MSKVEDLITKVQNNNSLTTEETKLLFAAIMSGSLEDEQIKSILLALKNKGETVDEITGAALILREKAAAITAPEGALDTCGTGGDGANTFNISTTVALVAAACGVPVAKHGNKAVSSKSGSADVLQELGVNLDVSLDVVQKAIQEIGIGFMMAPKHHAAMRHVAPVRKALNTRTIFNLLGPLANPAAADYQLLGVYSKEWLEPIAKTLHKLGTKRAWVVHGSDGLDELTTTGESYICSIDEKGHIEHFTVTPEECGLDRVKPEALHGGTSQENAKALLAVLKGELCAYRDIVLLNSAAALVVAGKAEDIKSGVKIAEKAIDSQKALSKLNELIEITNHSAN